MKLSKILISVFILLIMNACSSSRGGTGSPDQYDKFEEGNIPVSQRSASMRDINFAFDSSSLSSTAKGVLTRNAEWLNKNPDVNVIIEGHCDERGTAEYNLALGERRAKSAYDFLRNIGVKSGRMSTISYGEELPLDPGKNESAYAKNRRVHFAVKK